MKKLFILIIVCLASVRTLDAQTPMWPEYLYLYCNSIPSTNEGILRIDDTKEANNPLYRSIPIHFRMISKQKDIYIGFDHYNYDIEELEKFRPTKPAKDQMRIEYVSSIMLKYFSTFRPINLEDKLASLRTKEEAWAWVDSIVATGKRIYLLDWNDPANKSGNGQIKLIQVRLTVTNRSLF